MKTITDRDIHNVYLLVFLCMKTREVIVSISTARPNSRLVIKQTNAFIEQTADRKEKPSILMHDRDMKFTKEFVAMLKTKDIKTNALPVASPHLNGRVERFIQTIKYECLFKFILFGQWHLDQIVGQRVACHNRTRSHMERGHLSSIREVPEDVPKLDRDQIAVRSYVGGLVKS